MTYASVDHLQKVLSESVFHYAADKKKAAGRALGTLVEVVTFYLLKTWGLERYLAIERPLAEYRNDDITHNVEYSAHPSRRIAELRFPAGDLPLSSRKILKALDKSGAEIDVGRDAVKSTQLLSSSRVLRNSCVLAETGTGFVVATLASVSAAEARVAVHVLDNAPFAIAECKRVGLEEGTRKGPQTIEKAKQGAYVARTVSSLQKIRLSDGTVGGVLHRPDRGLICKPYAQFLEEIVRSDDPSLLAGFILTVGVVSNHGNWFTSDNHNKELKVLAQSYDWLLFLTDEGLSDFVTDLIVRPAKAFEPVRLAFLASYTGKAGKNQFTKVQMQLQADGLLQRYFHDNLQTVEKWFNVISPSGKRLAGLRRELHALAGKRWSEIRK